MTKTFIYFKISNFLVLLIATTFFIACQESLQEQSLFQENMESEFTETSQVQGKYIVVFKDDQFQLEEFSEDYEAAIGYLREEARALLTTYEADGAQPENLYAMAFQGFSVELTEEKKNQLQKDARVKSIEPDRIRVLGTL